VWYYRKSDFKESEVTDKNDGGGSNNSNNNNNNKITPI
jgi:hypothetical protein